MRFFDSGKLIELIRNLSVVQSDGYRICDVRSMHDFLHREVAALPSGCSSAGAEVHEEIESTILVLRDLAMDLLRLKFKKQAKWSV